MWKAPSLLTFFSSAICSLVLAQVPGGQAPAGKPAGKTEKPGLKFGAAPTPSEAEKLLDEAITKIEALEQYRADVRQVTEMLGYRFTADGQYAVAPDFRMLFELKVQLTDTTGSLKEVCDGRVHWRSQQILDTQEIVKIDVKKIREVLDKPQFNKDVRDMMVKRLGFSGIVPLMRGLRENQSFDAHQEDILNDVPVYVLDGQWREEAISQASYRGQALSLANLPPHIPNKTTLWIGQEDGWPYKFRMESTKKIQGFMTVITLEFLNPQIGVELPESLFMFEPPSGVRVEDQTDLLNQTLNSVLQAGQDTGARSKGSGEDKKAKSQSSSPESPTKASTDSKP